MDDSGRSSAVLGSGGGSSPTKLDTTTSETVGKPVGFSWWLRMICRREEGEKKEGGGGVLMGKRERKGIKEGAWQVVRWFKPGLKAIMSSSSRGSHLYVTCWSICDQDQDFDHQNVLDHLIVPSKALDHLIFYRSKVELELRVFDPLIFSLEVTLISSQKGLWSLDSILILVTNTSTWDIQETTPWSPSLFKPDDLVIKGRTVGFLCVKEESWLAARQWKTRHITKEANSSHWDIVWWTLVAPVFFSNLLTLDLFLSIWFSLVLCHSEGFMLLV